jgi:hypothetical protein
MVTMTRRVRKKALPALILAGGFVVLAFLAALVVTTTDVFADDGEPTTVLINGRAEVPRGQIQDDVMAVRGTVVIAGTVEGDVLLADGRVRVEGLVHGDVIVLHGDAVLGRQAEIGGDLRTSTPSRVARGAIVRGETVSVGPLDAVAAVPRTVWFGFWLAAGLCLLALAVIAPGPIGRGAVRAERRPARSFVLGAARLIAGPLVIAVLALSLIGSILAVVLGAALVVVGALGAAVTAACLGRIVIPRGEQDSMVVGTLGLGALLALVLLASPALAIVASGAAVAFGLGSLVPAPARRPRPVDVDDDQPYQLAWDLDSVPTRQTDDEGPRILAAFPITSGAGDRN